MNSPLEKIIAYCLGGIVGGSIGLLIFSAHMPMFDSMGSVKVFISITSVIGILISIAIIEYSSEKTLRKNSLIRDETVALITHEMRTGLTSTGWSLEMVIKKYSEHISKEDKELIQGVIDSIHTTVMHSVNLLDVSLLDIGKLSISLEWRKLDAVQKMFTEIMEKYGLGAIRNGVTFSHSIQLNPLKEAEVDMMRLRIVVENLLENSLQYTVGENKKISVEIANDDHHMNIKVSDTGMGIPESEQEKIFGEFYRASNARKKLSSGSGIGLYTCAQYVKAHHGTIRFESKEGAGTTFYVTIPLKTSADVHEFIAKI